MHSLYHLHKKKMNNKGMTLIEVLVAMAILAIIVTPTLRMFSTSSGMNLRAKKVQRATSMGESIMETFKAYTMEQLCYQFKYGTFKGSDGSVSVTASYPTGDASPLLTDDTLNNDATEIHFAINNATYDRSKYNIDIYAKPLSSPVIMNFDGPNQYTDAIIEIKETLVRENNLEGLGNLTLAEVFTELRDKAKTNFTDNHTDAIYNIGEVELSKVKRTIDINVSDDGTNQKVTKAVKYSCEAKVNYTKTVTGGATGATTTTGSQDITDRDLLTYVVKYADGEDESETFTVYDNSGTIAGTDATYGKKHKLNNIYLYYFPALEVTYGDDCEDEINITGALSSIYSGGDHAKATGNELLNFYIVRQVPTVFSSDALLLRSEARYNYKVNYGLGEGKCNILHNYGEWLVDRDSDEGYAAVPMNSSHLTGITDMDKYVKKISDGIVEKTNLIYTLKVEVYDAQTGKLMSEFTGTKNE